MTINDDCGPPQTQRPVALSQPAAQTFLTALETDLAANAANVIREVREERPLDYLRIAIGLLPGQIAAEPSKLEEMSDDQLTSLLRQLEIKLDQAGDSPGSERDRSQDAGAT